MNTLKQIITGLLSGLLFCSMIPSASILAATADIAGDSKTSYAVGDTFDDGMLTYTIIDSGAVSVTNCESGSSYVNIAGKIDGYNVTTIGDGAFEGQESMVSITIPNTITTIEEGAFNGCTGLTSITIPDSVTEIPAGCFQGCSGLTEINLGNGITEIGDMAFALCTGLQEITLPKTVTSVGINLFYNCNNLQQVTLPESLTTLGSQMFFACSALESITIPASVEDVGVMTFSGCTALKEIKLADGNEYYTTDNGILFDKNMEVLYCYPAAKTDTRYDLPNGVLVIAPSAFMCAANLTDMTLPQTLQYIGDSAFYACTALLSITIPESVTTIGDGAFSDCAALHAVTFTGAESESPSEEALTIGNYAFFCCDALLDVTLPERVSQIGSYAFGCTEEKDSNNLANAAGDEIAVKGVSGFLLTGYTGAAADYVKQCDVKISFKSLNFDWKSFVFWVVLAAVALVVVIVAVRIIKRSMLTREEKAALKQAKDIQKTLLSQRTEDEQPETDQDDGYRSILEDDDEEEFGGASNSITPGMTHFHGHATPEDSTQDK